MSERRPMGTDNQARTSDGILVVIPIFAMLLCLVPVGPIGPPVGFLLAIGGLLLGRNRPPSKNRTNLIVCSIFALIGTGLFFALQVVDWIR